VHGGIKASNVLLGRDLEARVADFGMARLVPRAAEHEEGKAMAAYQAKKAADEAGIPSSKATSEAGDVYSYGVLVLEMVSGRRPSRRAADGTRWSIVDWAMPLLAEGDDDDDDDDAERLEAMIDPRLEGRYNEEEAVRAIAAARACICTKPHQRPTMLDVLAVLKGESVSHTAN
jgi:serine/threonine protein kinase